MGEVFRKVAENKGETDPARLDKELKKPYRAPIVMVYVMDLIHLRYDKLKAEGILNDNTEELIKEIVEPKGKILLPSTEIEIDVYE